MTRRTTALAVGLLLALSGCGETGAGTPTGAASPSDLPSEAPVAAPEAEQPVGAPVLTAVPPPAPEPEPEPAPPADGGPGFTWAVSRVTAADLPSSWRDGCPVGPDSLRAVTVGFHTMDGGTSSGVIVLNSDVVDNAQQAFARLYEIGFPIKSIRPVDEFGGSDDASMAADNTSAFNCRAAVNNSGSTSWSKHAYGRAIDLNPVENPYVLDGEVLPPEGRPYVGREAAPGLVQSGSAALAAFTNAGFEWGGRWSNPDYQHFQIG